jgi:hypothetical protein
MSRLALILRIQAVVFAIYAVALLVFTDFTLDTVFGWEGVDLLWPRLVVVSFVALAWIEWLVADKLESRLDLVWPLVAVPALFVVVFVWSKAADAYQGTDAFWWTSIVVTVVFTAAVGWSRLAAEKAVD